MVAELQTQLDPIDSTPQERAHAYLGLRRIANRHGCHGDEPGANESRSGCHCMWPDPRCARCSRSDPRAHNRDVAALHEVLEVCGLEDPAVAAGGKAGATAGQAKAQRGETGG